MTVAETAQLPSLAPPEDEGVAHLTRSGHIANCGATKSGHAGHDWTGDSACCSCGAPVCPTCLQISGVYRDSGCWEGA